MIHININYIEFLEFVHDATYFQCIRTFKEFRCVNKQLEEEVEETDCQIVVSTGEISGDTVYINTRDLYDEKTKNFEYVWSDLVDMAFSSYIVRNQRYLLNDNIFKDVNQEVKNGKFFEQSSKFHGDFI